MPDVNCCCFYCSKELYRFPWILKSGRRVYCNSSHQMKYEYANGLRNGTKITENAHQTLRERGHYKRDNSYIVRYNKSAKKRKQMSEQRTGSGNHMWNKTPWNKLSPCKKWWEEKEFIELRKLALVRDNFMCVSCGIGSVDLYCDHIIPYRICKEHNLDNLQILCGSCHSKKTAVDLKTYPELKARSVFQ